MNIDWDMITSVATAIGVFVAAWQLWEARKVSQSSFEDHLDEQYRQLAYAIPVDVFLSKKIDKKTRNTAREWVYNYLDLCNEQIYLRMKNKISHDRRREWESGIRQNIRRPFFAEVLQEVEDDSLETFTYLERLIQEDYNTDPKNW